MNRKEKELFLALCTLCNPPRARLERLLLEGCATAGVLGLLFAHRVAGVACDVLRRTALSELAGPEFYRALCGALLLGEKRSEEYLGCLGFLAGELEACGVPYALLDGACLCGRCPGARRVPDRVEVLVRPGDLGRVSTRLQLAGFRQGRLQNGRFVSAARQQIPGYRQPEGGAVSFVRETRLPFFPALEVCLSAPVSPSSGDSAALCSILARTGSVPVGNGAVSARVPEPTDCLLDLCARLYRTATALPLIRQGQDMPLERYCEVCLLLRDWEKTDLRRALHRAQELGLRTALLYCLHGVDVFFGVPALRGLPLAPGEARALLEVSDPAAHLRWRYREADPVRRFFAPDRLSLLQEVPA